MLWDTLCEIRLRPRCAEMQRRDQRRGEFRDFRDLAGNGSADGVFGGCGRGLFERQPARKNTSRRTGQYLASDNFSNR